MTFFVETMHKFRMVFLTFLLVLILSTIVYIAYTVLPTLEDILVASTKTPWGIVTSLFMNLGAEHLVINVVGLLMFFLLFVTSNISLSMEETRRRVLFFLVVTFLIATLCNFFWIFLLPFSVRCIHTWGNDNSLSRVIPFYAVAAKRNVSQDPL